MIAGIADNADIEIYMKPEELEAVGNSIVQGVLIKIQHLKRQGTISLSVNEERKNENGFGIGLDYKQYWGFSENFRIDVFLGTEWYRELLSGGQIGTRHRMLDGSKINIYDVSKIGRYEKVSFESLEFYRDNKDRLRGLL